MVDDWVIRTMYATKRRRRTVKSVKPPVKDPPKSNPSKRHRERLNSELDHLASLLPFEQSVISKLDKLSILRLGVSYLRTKNYFAAVAPHRYGIESHLMSRSHLFHEPGFSEGESILQALYGFLFVVTCDGEVFYASRTVEQYLGFHQSDIIHQSVMELIHSEDRDEFKRQLTWNSMLPQDKASLQLHEVMLPENYHYLHRSFTVRFRCLLDNTSGFITLEISGWLRVLHGQNLRTEEPQLALFATCCPFGPLSLFDIPSRELTFKSKHKMDFSPVTMDNRGKMMFGYSDQELAVKSGYDLIHPDDLNYFASAHQELIKTGSSGLIAYRWQTKDFQWFWLQSSCKVIYKNSKPDFIICTHRQLTDDEGQDLFFKRGNEFKLPYPLLDMDLCSGFGFPDDDFSKSKSSKKKKASQNGRDCSQQSVKKRKQGACILPGLNGYGTYPPFNETGEFKADLLYSYGGNNFAYDNDLYRSHGYGPLPGGVYPTGDAYRLDGDKTASLGNGYFLEPRQYTPYPTPGYADIVAGSSKYPGYEVPKYGFDAYSLDLSKKHCVDDLAYFDSDVRKLGYDFHADRFPPRLGSGLEPMDLRSASMYGANSFMNTIEGSVAPACISASPFFKSVPGQSSLHGKDGAMAVQSSLYGGKDLAANGQGGLGVQGSLYKDNGLGGLQGGLYGKDGNLSNPNLIYGKDNGLMDQSMAYSKDGGMGHQGGYYPKDNGLVNSSAFYGKEGGGIQPQAGMFGKDNGYTSQGSLFNKENSLPVQGSPFSKDSNTSAHVPMANQSPLYTRDGKQDSSKLMGGGGGAAGGTGAGGGGIGGGGGGTTGLELMSLPHNSVIKNNPGVRENPPAPLPSLNPIATTVLHNANGPLKTLDLSEVSPWSTCGKATPRYTPGAGGGGGGASQNSSPRQLSSPEVSCTKACEMAASQKGSPKTVAAPASVIHSRACEKQPGVGGIPVPVVKSSPWLHQYANGHLDKDWAVDMFACPAKTSRSVLADSHHKTLGLKSGGDRNDNPLLAFSEVTHTLLSTSNGT